MNPKMISMSLLYSLDNTLISSDIAVVIVDKYPKAKHHYLVCPKENVPSIFHLGPNHLPLLDDMNLLASNIIELRGMLRSEFNVGFHAEPSMQHLHLHVISRDFISDCLKTKKHWNSFNTRFFIPFKQLRMNIESSGSVDRLKKETIKQLISSDLQCNRCDFIGKNMPKLKDHLLTHDK